MAYTKEQHIAALRKAVDAGDMAAAEQIAATLDAMPQAPEEEKSLYDGMLDAVDTVGGVVKAGAKGFSFGAAKPINAGIYAAGEKLMGDERPIGEIFDDELEQEQADMDKFSEENAALAMGAEITGAILSPINKALGAIKLGKGAIATTGSLAAQGAVGGSGYVFLDTNGSIVERLDAASSVAVPSAMFGVVGGKLMSVSTDVFKKVFAKTLGTKQGNSTTAILKSSKNAAYQLVKDNNIRFGGSMVNKAKNAFVAKVQASKTFSSKSKIHADTMELVEELTVSSRGKGVELLDLDVAQQALWKKYKAAKINGEETVVLDAINMIDDLIQAHPSTSEAMSVARLANKRFQKAATVDRIMEKIKVDESFKGKSSVDQLKAGLAKILNNPRDAKHYDDVEIARFKEFIADSGTHSQKFLTQLGKLAPTNALNQLLTVGTAGAVGGAAGAIGVGATAAVTSAAKKYAQGAADRRSAAFASEMRGNGRAAAPTTAQGGMLTGQFADAKAQDNRDMSMLKLRRAAR